MQAPKKVIFRSSVLIFAPETRSVHRLPKILQEALLRIGAANDQQPF